MITIKLSEKQYQELKEQSENWVDDTVGTVGDELNLKFGINTVSLPNDKLDDLIFRIEYYRDGVRDFIGDDRNCIGTYSMYNGLYKKLLKEKGEN
jgi:hypothetical protein